MVHLKRFISKTKRNTETHIFLKEHKNADAPVSSSDLCLNHSASTQALRTIDLYTGRSHDQEHTPGVLDSKRFSNTDQ